MKSTGILLPLVSMVAITMLVACNLPASKSNSLPVQQLALTIVAQTAQAATATAAANQAPAAPAAPAVPAGPIGPNVTVSTATNCRTGPDPNYPFVMLFSPGMNAPVVGKYSPANYWVITMPNGGTCWLWGAYASVQGDTSKLPESTPPQLVLAVQPTATSPAKKSSGGTSGTSSGGGLVLLNPNLLLYPPSAPSGVKASTNCSGGRTDLITWHSQTDADGYNIYEGGKKIAKITAAQAGTGGFSMYSVSPGNIQTPITYGVSAYNSFGTSSISSASAPGCP